MMKFMADQEKLQELLESENIPKEVYKDVLEKHQELMIRLITDIEARKERSMSDIIENLRNKVQQLQGISQRAGIPMLPNQYYNLQ